MSMDDADQMQVSFTVNTVKRPDTPSTPKSEVATIMPSKSAVPDTNLPGSIAKTGPILSSLFTAHTELNTPISSKIQDAGNEKINFEPSNGVANAIDGDEDSSINAFASLGLYPALAKHLQTKLKLHQPTPIQRSALSHFISNQPLEQSDVIIKAQTGSGKTLAYLLPILDTLLRQPAPLNGENTRLSGGTLGLILCPTRELAHQVHEGLDQLLSLSYPNRWIVSGLLTGGEKKKSEKARLRKGL